MNLSLTEHWENFIEEQVKNGRYKSASEVIRDGLRLLEKETQLEYLRNHLENSIRQGGSNTSEEVLSEVRDHLKNINL